VFYSKFKKRKTINKKKNTNNNVKQGISCGNPCNVEKSKITAKLSERAETGVVFKVVLYHAN
jgi:ribosomal protein L34E